jgi:hypothetical protein
MNPTVHMDIVLSAFDPKVAWMYQQMQLIEIV